MTAMGMQFSWDRRWVRLMPAVALALGVNACSDDKDISTADANMLMRAVSSRSVTTPQRA